jgi:hypothetical protein
MIYALAITVALCVVLGIDCYVQRREVHRMERWMRTWRRMLEGER